MKFLKKFLSLALVLSMILGLGIFTQVAQAEEKKEEVEEKVIPEDRIEVVFWHAMTGPTQEAVTLLADKFNEAQDVYFVNEQNQGYYSDLQQKILASARAGELPALAQTTYTVVPEYKDEDIIISLTEYVEGENGFSEEVLKDFYPAFLDSSKVGEEYFSMPFSKSTRVMFYNQDILDEYNEGKIPTTWDEVLELADKMKDSGIYAMGLENSLSMEIETMAIQNGAEWISEDLVADMGSDKAIEAFQFIMDMINNEQARTAGEDGFMSGPFANGASALYIGSSAGVSYVKAPAEESGINWGTAEIPTFNDTQLTQFAGNDLVIFKGLDKEVEEGAWAFIKFLLEPENTALWAMNTGYLPLRESALEEEEYKKFLEENPEYAAATLELAYGYSSRSFVGFTKYRSNMLDKFELVLTTGADVAETMTELQEETQEILDEAKAAKEAEEGEAEEAGEEKKEEKESK